jgi:hypothetical protein
MVSMNCDPILQSVTAFFKGISSVRRGQTSPQHVAEKTIEALNSGMNNVLADRQAEDIWQAPRHHPEQPHSSMQAMGGAGRPSMVN